jgi:hypothetical protein
MKSIGVKVVLWCRITKQDYAPKNISSSLCYIDALLLSIAYPLLFMQTR